MNSKIKDDILESLAEFFDDGIVDLPHHCERLQLRDSELDQTVDLVRDLKYDVLQFVRAWHAH